MIIETLVKIRETIPLGMLPFVGLATLIGAVVAGGFAYVADREASREKARLGSDVLLIGDDLVYV